MKKIFLSLFLGLFLLPFATKLEAQDYPFQQHFNVFQKGFQFFDVGLGLNTRFQKFPPLILGYEYGITDHLFDANSAVGVGAAFSYAAADYYQSFFIGPKLSLHYSFADKLDTYCSLILAYQNVSNNNNMPANYHVKDSPIGFGAHIGARYMFAQTVGALAEIGYGIAYLNLGVSIAY